PAARGGPCSGAGRCVPLLRSYLQEQGTTAEALIIELLDGLDIEAHLVGAGLGAGDITALRSRLVAD
ncbi:MAG: hypothetical protein QOD73_1170, partial [Solirubrobacteraceae bacterium]|nr:hypothetical protein [Solirubrobacteraceae bacterium]